MARAVNADSSESDNEHECDAAEGSPPMPATFACAIESLADVRSYLEAAGCQSNDRLYNH